jgi:glucoside 3-dehydrogenase (cytochrome c) hitch-hiker subunit
MNRREALRLLATSAVLPLAPGNLLAALRQAREIVGAQALPSPQASRTLNPHQYATVQAMAELILPRTDTPGATDVGTAEFIDLILTEWSEERERLGFLTGLAELDARMHALFGRDFIECSVQQQQECLAAMGERMTQNAESLRGHSRQLQEAVEADVHFYPTFRRLTLTAYYTSEAGATQALHYQIIPDRHDSCAEAGSVSQKTESQ